MLKRKALRRLGVVPKRVDQKMLLTSKVLCFNVKVLPLQILMDSFKEHRYEMHVDISTCELIAFRKFHEFNKIHTTDPFLYPLKTSENQSFLCFSRGIERE